MYVKHFIYMNTFICTIARRKNNLDAFSPFVVEDFYNFVEMGFPTKEFSSGVIECGASPSSERSPERLWISERVCRDNLGLVDVASDIPRMSQNLVHRV